MLGAVSGGGLVEVGPGGWVAAAVDGESADPPPQAVSVIAIKESSSALLCALRPMPLVTVFLQNSIQTGAPHAARGASPCLNCASDGSRACASPPATPLSRPQALDETGGFASPPRGGFATVVRGSVKRALPPLGKMSPLADSTPIKVEVSADEHWKLRHTACWRNSDRCRGERLRASLQRVTAPRALDSSDVTYRIGLRSSAVRNRCRQLLHSPDGSRRASLRALVSREPMRQGSRVLTPGSRASSS